MLSHLLEVTQLGSSEAWVWAQACWSGFSVVITVELSLEMGVSEGQRRGEGSRGLSVTLLVPLAVCSELQGGQKHPMGLLQVSSLGLAGGINHPPQQWALHSLACSSRTRSSATTPILGSWRQTRFQFSSVWRTLWSQEIQKLWQP